MDCDAAIVAISARVDGELAETDPLHVALEGHLSSCSSCRAWESRSFALRRTLVLRRPAPPEGLAVRVLANMSVPHTGAGQWVRYCLGVVAASIVVLNIPLLLGLTATASSHEVRHLGTFGVALGIGLLWAARKPERAIGLVPLATALAMAMLLGSVADIGRRQATLVSESIHLLEFTGLGLLWYLSGGAARLRHNAQSLSLRNSPSRS